jgi:hypothetical protein
MDSNIEERWKWQAHDRTKVITKAKNPLVLLTAMIAGRSEE